MKSPTGYSNGRSKRPGNRGKQTDLRPQTMWVILHDIGTLPDSEVPAAVVRFCEPYREAVTRELEFHISRLHHSGREHPDLADAADVAHEFLFVHVADRCILQKADAVKGRFRDFLWACLRNFWKDKCRQIKAMESLEDVGQGLADPRPRKPGEAFDRAVATSFANQVLFDMERQQRAAGKAEIFRILRPCLLDRPHGQQKILARKLGATEPTVCKWLKELEASFKRKFREHVCRDLREPQNPGDVDEEMKYLLLLWLAAREEAVAP